MKATSSLLFVLILGALFLSATGSALGADWPMIQRDPQHSGSAPSGPTAPLKQAWGVQTTDPENSFTTWPIVKNGVAFAASGDGVLAVEAESGRRKWFKEQEGGSLIVAPAADDARLFISVGDGRLVALDQETGDQIWSYQTDNDLGSVTSSDGGVFVGSNILDEGKSFYRVDAATGSLVWEVSARFSPDVVPAVSGGIVVVATTDVSSEAGQLIALDEVTGKTLWESPAPSDRSSPAVLDDKVVFGGGDFFAHALDLKTGKEIWKSPMEGKFVPENSPASAYGDVFLADRVGNIYRLDGKTGKQKWIWGDSQGLDIVGFDNQFPVIAGKTLYIGNGAGWLYALNVDSGQLLWQHQVGGFVYSGAADEERFYFGVKFRNEGLYAYEHDPSGKLEPPPSARSAPSRAVSLIAGVFIFALIAGGLVILSRRGKGAPG